VIVLSRIIDSMTNPLGGFALGASSHAYLEFAVPAPAAEPQLVTTPA
jgi:hypothetical protein